VTLDEAASFPKSTVAPRATRPVKRSFSIRGHRTSISLEHAFWEALNDIASERRMSLAQLVSEIDETRGTAGLSGSVRIHILDHYRQRAHGTDSKS
jgi:predicted DNA-binding ribbon-helix-helix protein